MNTRAIAEEEQHESDKQHLSTTSNYLLRDNEHRNIDNTEKKDCNEENTMVVPVDGPSMTFVVSSDNETGKVSNEDQPTTAYRLNNEKNITEIHTDEGNRTIMEVDKENHQADKIATTSDVITEQPPAYFTSYGNTDIQSQLSTRSAYEVTTFVTEDGQTGQIIISGDGSYPREMNTAGGTITLGDIEISSGGGNVLSLEEDSMEQIPGLDNFSSESMQVERAHSSDGSTHFQYILKEDANIRDNNESSSSSTSSSSLQTSAPRKVFECMYEKCGKQFSSSYRLKLHSRIHTGDTFTCVMEGCSKTFLSQPDLQKHTKSHLGQKDFICEYDGCRKEYTTAHHLKVHRRQHSGERPFLCDWEGCGKMFTTGYGLKSHFRTHTNERPYKCQYDNCGKAFKTSGDLQKHVRTHTGERPFQCTFPGCHLSFTTSNIRKVHLRTHTGEKPYKCEFNACGRTFASATNYKNHKRIHTGERPYVCEVSGCMKRFTEYSSLYKHNIVHTQHKPYTCSVCNKTYRQTSTLAMHKRTAHGTDEFVADTDKDAVNKSRSTSSPAPKRQKISRQQSSYLQGMSLIIDNGETAQELSARISAQNIAESTEIPGAIAIPIQVTMNADGTIAGAPGLNLTDGNGRIIPVNLSVSIPVSSLAQVNNENSEDSNGSSTQAINTIFQVTDDTGEITPRQTNSATSTDEDDVRQIETTNGRSVATVISTINQTGRNLIQVSNDFENSDDDPDDRDVTDKYLTSHYRKDVKTPTMI